MCPWLAYLFWPKPSRSATSKPYDRDQAARQTDKRDELETPAGGGKTAALPVYAKPPTYYIYYNASSKAWPDATKIAMAKYSAVTLAADLGNIENFAQSMNAVRAINPDIKFFIYAQTAEAANVSHDYGGTYGSRGAKLTAANWFLRNAANRRFRSYGGSADGTAPHAYKGDTFLNERGHWAGPGTAYGYNDVVQDAGIDKLCIVPHTSRDTMMADAAKWSTYLGIMAVNYLPGAMPKHDDIDWATWYARHVHTIGSRAGMTWDGVYLDHFGYTDETIPLDWSNTSNDVRMDADASSKRACEEFLRSFITELKLQFGADTKILGNSNNGTLLNEFLVARNMGPAWADGVLHETAVAPSVNWSPLCTSGVSRNGSNTVMYSWMIKAQSVKDPSNSLSAIGTKPSSDTDYKTVRLGIALALMQNARSVVTMSGGYNASFVPWFDEWDQPLGTGIEPVRSTWSGTSQVWKRRFENGVVIINESKLAVGRNRGKWASDARYAPGEYVQQEGLCRVCKYGQGHVSSASFSSDSARWHTMTGSVQPNWIAGAPQTIDDAVIPYGIYRRISGTQDPVQNNGAIVDRAFSLDGWDAIILLCVNSGIHA